MSEQRAGIDFADPGYQMFELASRFFRATITESFHTGSVRSETLSGVYIERKERIIVFIGVWNSGDRSISCSYGRQRGGRSGSDSGPRFDHRHGG
jgi:hypothetical protein